MAQRGEVHALRETLELDPSPTWEHWDKTPGSQEPRDMAQCQSSLAYRCEAVSFIPSTALNAE